MTIIIPARPERPIVVGGNTPRPIAAGGTGATTAGAARTALGLAIGSDVQAYDAGLTSIAGLTTAADRMIYTTAADTYAVATLTAAGRALLDDADAAAQRATLGAQADLGFTPVEQGGGVGHGSNKINLGWDDVSARLTVDGLDQGRLVRNTEAAAGTNGAISAPGGAPLYAARAWVNFNGTGTVAIRVAGNVSSITDNGVGDYTINFTTAMPDANYAIVGTASTISGSLGIVSSLTDATDFNKTTTSVRVGTYSSGAALVDFPSVNVVIFR